MSLLPATLIPLQAFPAISILFRKSPFSLGSYHPIPRTFDRLLFRLFSASVLMILFLFLSQFLRSLLAEVFLAIIYIQSYSLVLRVPFLTRSWLISWKKKYCTSCRRRSIYPWDSIFPIRYFTLEPIQSLNIASNTIHRDLNKGFYLLQLIYHLFSFEQRFNTLDQWIYPKLRYI